MTTRELINAMEKEVSDMLYEYNTKDIPVKEEHPFNIEYHIGRYHVYREILEGVNPVLAEHTDNKFSSTIDTMHEYIDNFITNIFIGGNK